MSTQQQDPADYMQQSTKSEVNSIAAQQSAPQTSSMQKYIQTSDDNQPQRINDKQQFSGSKQGLEEVQERSIESENTYRASLLGYDPPSNAGAAQNNRDEKILCSSTFGNGAILTDELTQSQLKQYKTANFNNNDSPQQDYHHNQQQLRNFGDPNKYTEPACQGIDTNPLNRIEGLKYSQVENASLSQEQLQQKIAFSVATSNKKNSAVNANFKGSSQQEDDQEGPQIKQQIDGAIQDYTDLSGAKRKEDHRGMLVQQQIKVDSVKEMLYNNQQELVSQHWQQQQLQQQILEQTKQRNLELTRDLERAKEEIQLLKYMQSEQQSIVSSSVEDFTNQKKTYGKQNYQQQTSQSMGHLQYQMELQKLEQINMNLQQENIKKNMASMKFQEEKEESERQRELAVRKMHTFQTNIELLETENRQLKKEKKSLQDSVFDLKIMVDKIQQQNEGLHDKLEAHSKDMSLVLKEREELLNRLDYLQSTQREQDISFQMKLDEAILEQKKKIEEKQNNIITDLQYKFHLKEQKYKEKISRQQDENESLIQMIPQLSGKTNNNTNRMKESETQFSSIQSPSYLQQGQRNSNYNSNMLISNNDEMIFTSGRGGEASSNQQILYTRLIKQLQTDLSIKNLDDLPQKIREIKSQQKFTDCIIDMVVSCHPRDQFGEERPSLKQSWKWLKKLMEDYMNLKKNENSMVNSSQEYTSSAKQDNDILNRIILYTGIENKRELIPSIQNMQIDIQLANKILWKIKKILKMEYVNTFKELDEELQKKYF